MVVTDPARTDLSAQPDMPSPYIVPLSSNLNQYSAFPQEVTFAQIEPHGAILLCRFVSGERVEQFELSGSEVDALLATSRRRRRFLSRASRAVMIELGDLSVLPF